ncbi:hypothetical protein [Clostridium cuniculi]|uniref:hypothetical protein n=1 Tax=Clostridium cuniculi TaxID=2548455 RepID=UPI00140FF72D|nr:hypothetical protein [Clostridium cuniculi]
MSGYFKGIKPIQATPNLKGNDAVKFVGQVYLKADKEEIEKNKFLLKILNKIKK